jgi:hypothetical protein
MASVNLIRQGFWIMGQPTAAMDLGIFPILLRGNILAIKGQAGLLQNFRFSQGAAEETDG